MIDRFDRYYTINKILSYGKCNTFSDDNQSNKDQKFDSNHYDLFSVFVCMCVE